MEYKNNNTLFGEVEKASRNLLGENYYTICNCCGAKVEHSSNDGGFVLKLDVGDEKKEKPMKIFQYVEVGRVTIGECCFPKLEAVILERIEKIIPWGIKKTKDRRATLLKEVEEIEEEAKRKVNFKRTLADEELQLLSLLEAKYQQL